MLDRKNIATAVTGDDPAKEAQAMLGLLRQGGMHVDGTLVIHVSKDIDAVLALTFGQAHAALVTSNSIDVLKRINPSAAASLRTVYTTEPILRPPLCVVGDPPSPSQIAAVAAVFTQLLTDVDGKKVMYTLGIDAWVPFEPSMLGK